MRKILTYLLLITLFFGSQIRSFAQCNEILSAWNEESPNSGSMNIYWYSENSGAVYSIEYGIAGFTPGSGAVIQGAKQSKEGSTTINGLLDNTEYTYYIQENCGNDLSPLSGPYGFMTDKACRRPNNFQITPGATFIQVNWTSFNQGATYKLSYGEGVNPDMPGSELSGESVTNNSFRIENLTASTQYWVKLAEQCEGGEESNVIWTIVSTSSSCDRPEWVSLDRRGRDFLDIYWGSSNFNNENISVQGGYTVEYGPAHFTPGTGTTITGSFNEQNVKVRLSGLQAETVYDIYVSESCDEGASTMSGPFTFSTLEECAQADNFYAYNSAVGEVKLNIETYNPGAAYHIEYGPSGFTSGQGIEITGNFSSTSSETTITVSNLNPNTEYEFRLIESCLSGGTTGMISTQITTLGDCPSPQYLYAENESVGVVELDYETFQPGVTYEVEYGPHGFPAGTGTVITGKGTGKYVEITITGLEPSTFYEFRLTEICSESTQTTPISTNITTLESCPEPYDAELEYADAYDIGIEWDSYNIGQSFVVEYGPSGFVPGSGTKINGTIKESNELVVAGLNPETEYDLYLTEQCANGESQIIGPFTATTSAPVAAPVNDACANAITVTAGTTTPNTYPGSNIGATGNDKPGACFFEGGSFSKGVWYKYTPDDNTPVNFNLCNGKSNYDTRIEIYTGSCQSLHCLKGEDDDEACQSNDPNVSIPVQTGVVYYIYVSGYESEKGDFELDVQKDPSYVPCADPENFQLTSVTENSAEISWTSGNAGSEYGAAVGLAGWNPFTDSEVAGTDGVLNSNNVAVFNGLSPATDYDFYVYEVCGENDFVFAGPFAFATANITSSAVGINDQAKLAYDGSIVKLVNFNNRTVEEIGVYNLSGISVPYTFEGDEISLNEAIPGMYIVTVRDGKDQIHRMKIVVK